MEPWQVPIMLTTEKQDTDPDELSDPSWSEKAIFFRETG
jgi:hypothetical protein